MNSRSHHDMGAGSTSICRRKGVVRLDQVLVFILEFVLGSNKVSRGSRARLNRALKSFGLADEVALNEQPMRQGIRSYLMRVLVCATIGTISMPFSS